jgi:DNA-binding ferritin-like protein
MKESPEELERKATKYRRLARDVGDKPTADRILTLAEELEQQAHKLKLEKE